MLLITEISTYGIAFLPYVAISLTGIGLYFLLSSQYDHFSKKELKRLERFFSIIEEKASNERLSLWKTYRKWITKTLIELGYESELGLFDSMTRSIFLFFLFATFFFLYLAGSKLLTSIFMALLFAFCSLLIPHIILLFFRRRYRNRIDNEYLIVTNYISDALQGAEKDIYKALDEARTLTTIINDALQHFLNRQRTQGLVPACDALVLEIPVPSTEQFITIISNGFEYRDRQNLMEYIQSLNHMKHSMVIDAKERKEKQREHLYGVLVIIPAMLTIAITLSTAYARVSGVLSNTIW